MKSYFVFASSKDFPEACISAYFPKYNEAHEYLMRMVWVMQALFDFDCRVIHKNTQCDINTYHITNEPIHPSKGDVHRAKNITLQIHKTNLFDADHA